jgi:hypothetical protein
MGEKKRNQHIYHIIALVVGLSLAIISVRYLLLTDTSLIPEHRDVQFPPLLTNISNNYFFTWSELGSSASFEGTARAWYSFRLFFSFNVATFSRFAFVFYYAIMFFIPYLSFFYLFKNFLNYDTKVSFLTALTIAFVYSFNPHVIQAYSPPQMYAVSYALLPALAVSLIATLENNQFYSKLLLAAAITLIITSISRYIIHVFILIVIITSLYIIQFFRNNEFSFKIFAKKCVMVGLLLFFLNLYWIAPALVANGSRAIQPSYVVTYEITKMFSTSYTITDIFTLSASWYPTLALTAPPFLTGAAWTFLLFSIPILSVASLLLWKSFRKKEKFLALSAALVYLIGFSLLTGVNNPLPFLSDLYSFFLLSVNPSIGWMFRVPGYFGTLVVLATSLLLGLLIANVINRIQNSKKPTRKYLYTSLIVAIVLISGTVGWQRFTGNLDGVLDNGYYTEDAVGKLENNNRFITLLTNYTGDFQPHRTGEPYFTLPNDLDSYLKKTNNEQLIAYVMQILNAKNLITNLNLGNKYLDKSSTTIYDLPIFQLNQAETSPIRPIKELIFFDGNWQYLSPLSMVTSPEYGLTTENIESSQIILNPESPNLILSNEKTNVLYLAPFYSTTHYSPSTLWSKAGTNDPLHGEWHSYLEERGLENWDSDYGKGLVFTWAPSKLVENHTPTTADLVNQWTFNLTDDINQWQNYTRETQDNALNLVSYDNGALKTELWNSTEGWKTINSPTISAEYGNWYRWELQVKGENAQSVHIKIAEYDQEQKLINAYRVASVGSGNFDWKKITIDYTPENPETKYIQLQVWHGHETTQPLPNTIWIDNVKIYNMQNFVEPVSLELPFTVSETGEYVFLTRVFQNQQGGEIQVQLDNASYTVNTRDQLNEFTWEQMGTVSLQEGRHEVTLTNVEGFNAVNLFALVPKEQFEAAQNRLAEALQDKRVVYVFEGENDFYSVNAVASGGFGGEASSGGVLELPAASKAWREFEVLKAGNYTFAIRSKGNLSVTIDEKTYFANSTMLDWTYIGPVALETGRHKIEFTYPTTYYAQWSFENGAPQEWTGSNPKVQTMNVDEDAYEGNYSLKAELNASTWGWKTINSPLVPVSPDTKYSWQFYVAGENAYSAHAKIVEYDINKKPLTTKYVKSIGNGNFTWTQINFDYTPSENASFIQLQVWHGHETTQPLPNTIWIDDVKVYDSSSGDHSDLDVVWLYSTQSSNETLEDVFATGKASAEVMSYQKIDSTKYVVTVNASAPFMLSFGEAYDPLWTAQVNGKRIAPVSLFSVVNGFWVDQTGVLDITIEYSPQEWFYYGSAVSVTALVICAVYLVYGWVKNKSVWKKIKALIAHPNLRLRFKNAVCYMLCD